VVAAVLLVLIRFGVPIIFPDAKIFGVLGGILCAMLVVLWWAFFSRAPWPDRLGAIVLMVLGLMATSCIIHESIKTGMMGMMFPIYAIPVLTLALVAWAVATARLSNPLRRASMLAMILLACGAWTLVRTGGIMGDGSSQFAWRWSKTPEQRLLVAPTNHKPTIAPPTTAAASKGGEWPGFRGPNRDAIIRGVRIRTDWSNSPPVQLWRRPIGPGWSSFAVHDDFLYTQEQRGDDEVVSSYKMTSGESLWQHHDRVRFWESNGGAGPRATPTLSHGRLYTFGATGILNALDATTGALLWSRNVASDTDTKIPGWGFSSSPLVVGDLVIVAATGTLVAYDLANGSPRWAGSKHGGSYSSPHQCLLDGVTQILLLSDTGLTSLAATNGALLWEHSWPGVTILQPALLGDGDLLISTGGASGGVGTRRLTVAHKSGGWTVAERWTSRGLKPYFNDLVVHKGHAFGFDGSLLACIELQDGTRKWKGGRYGNGQLVLLADEDLLLVLSEQGELALVGATPDQFSELARFPAIEGKTWNHPVLVGDILLVRNDQEMAAFRLNPWAPLTGALP